MPQPTLTFQLSNPDPRADGKAVLYRSTEPGSLALTIENGPTPVPLKPGPPIDENKPDPAGATSLFLNFTGLVKDGVSNLREVKVSLPGWKVELLTGAIGVWALTPEKEGILVANGSLTITLDNILTNPDITTGEFSVDYYNFGAGQQNVWLTNVQVADPPVAGKGNLARQISAFWLNSVDNIYVSPQGGPTLNNELNFTLFYSGNKAIKATNATIFSFYFVYGSLPGPGALCTETEANNIDLRTVATYGNGWMGGKNAVSPQPRWDYRFRGTAFGTGENAAVDFKISELKTTLQPGSTQMYITWNNLPEFNDGQMGIPIRKIMPPIIKSFTATPASIEVADQSSMVPVTVKWEVDNCDSVTVASETGFAPKGETTVLMGYAKQEVLLTAVFGNGTKQPVKQRLKVPVTIAAKPEPSFEKFSLSPQQLSFVDNTEYEVTVEWAVRNASAVFFEGGFLTDVKALNGSRDLTVPFEKFHQLPDRPDFWKLLIKINAVNLSNTKTSTKSAGVLLSRRRLYEAKLNEIVGVFKTYTQGSYMAIVQNELAEIIPKQLLGSLIPMIKDLAIKECQLMPGLIASLQAYLDTGGTLNSIPGMSWKEVSVKLLLLTSRFKEYASFQWSEILNMRNEINNVSLPSAADYAPGAVDLNGHFDKNASFPQYVVNAMAVVLSYHNPIPYDFKPENIPRSLREFIDRSATSEFEYTKGTVQMLIKDMETLVRIIDSAYPKANRVSWY